MTREEALEKLELSAEASEKEIQEKFNEFYNEFQIQKNNG